MKYTLILVSVLVLMFLCEVPLAAQIPNAGFENWANSNPVGWTTSNLVQLNVTSVTQSAAAHSGSSALKGAIVPYVLAGINWYAYITAGYPYSQRSASLTGWYQLVSAAGSKDSLYIATYLYKTKSVIAAASTTIQPSSSWKQFTIPLYYISNAVPDSAWTWIWLASSTTGSTTGTIGSYFLLDDLSYSGTATAVNQPAGVPENFTLEQNYPNPFNPSTTINFSVARSGHVTLKIYNLLGTEIASLVNEAKNAGTYTVNWNAAGLPSGMYTYRMTVSSEHGTVFSNSRRLVLLE